MMHILKYIKGWHILRHRGWGGCQKRVTDPQDHKSKIRLCSIWTSLNNPAQGEGVNNSLLLLNQSCLVFEFILKHIEAWWLLVIGEVPQSQEAEGFLKILRNSSDIFKHINWQVLHTNMEVTFWKYWSAPWVLEFYQVASINNWIHHLLKWRRRRRRWHSILERSNQEEVLLPKTKWSCDQEGHTAEIRQFSNTQCTGTQPAC